MINEHITTLVKEVFFQVGMTDAVVLETCLYVGAAAFIRELKGYPLIQKNIVVPIWIDPINRRRPQILFLSNAMLNSKCCHKRL